MAKTNPRKILTAALGVATVSYVAGCGRTIPNDESRDNGDVLNADASVTHTPEVDPAATDPANTNVLSPVNPGFTISGNLLPPPETTTPSHTTVVEADDTYTSVSTYQDPGTYISGNLLPPPTSLPSTYPPDWTTVVPATTGTTGSDPYTDPTTIDGTAIDETSVVVDAGSADGGKSASTTSAPVVETSPFDAGIIISGNLLPPPAPDAGAQTEE